MKLLKTNQESPNLDLTFSLRSYIKLAALVIITYFIFVGIEKAFHAIVLIFIAFFLTLALNSPVHWISKKIPGKRRGSRAIATTLSYLLVIIVVASFLSYIVPPLINQTQNLIKVAPGIINDIRNSSGPVGVLIRQYHLQHDVSRFSIELEHRLNNAIGTSFTTLENISSSLFSVLTVLVITFMMLVEGPRWLNIIHKTIPKNNRAKIEKLSTDMYQVIKGFVNGKVILAFIAALLILPALLILHINYPAALFFVIFICGLIPMVGHTIGAIIVTIVGLFHAPSAGIIILIYYVIYQQIENYYIQPKLQANTTNLSPLLVFLALVVGVSFDGLLGGLIAIPVAACLRILVVDFLQSKNIL